MRRTTAASIIGKEAYPPTPITAFGFNRPRIRIASKNPRAAASTPASRADNDLPTTPPLRTATSVNPPRSTIDFSSGSPRPANTIRAPGRRRIISSAIAIPGYRWPPVPPPAITYVSSNPPHPALRSLRVLRAVEQHPERDQVHDQARPAVAQERQRHPLRRQAPERHADVDEGLQREPQRDPHRQVVAAPVGRALRRPQPAPEEHAERRDHERRADEPQ